MKRIIILLLSTLSLGLNAQNMEKINEKVVQLFVASDNRDWQALEDIFAPEVELDYSSMNGNPAVNLTPAQIIESWKAVLPGFTHTHHQLGNFITTQKGDKAEIFCYGTATHYLEHEKGNVWTVVGTYDLELIKAKKGWQVSKMKFNFKYMDGNTGLPQVAIDNVKAKQ